MSKIDFIYFYKNTMKNNCLYKVIFYWNATWAVQVNIGYRFLFRVYFNYLKPSGYFIYQ